MLSINLTSIWRCFENPATHTAIVGACPDELAYCINQEKNWKLLPAIFLRRWRAGSAVARNLRPGKKQKPATPTAIVGACPDELAYCIQSRKKLEIVARHLS